MKQVVSKIIRLGELLFQEPLLGKTAGSGTNNSVALQNLKEMN